MTTCIIIPARDEEAALPAVLRSVRAALPSAELLVVDNASTDRTAEVASAGGAAVLREDTPGYGSACLRAIRHLSGRPSPPRAVAILDADGADDPTMLPSFFARLQEADELVLSTRTRGGAEPGSLSTLQRWGNRLQTAWLNRRFGLQLTDMGPMRALRFSTLLDLEMVDRTWGWNVEMAAKAGRAGLKVVELPVPYRRRQAGRSKISGSLVGALRAGSRILWALWTYAR